MSKETAELDEDQIRYMKANYYSLNTLIDDWIGRIINVLRQQGLYENTVIIYTSDHGDLLGDHGYLFKECLYEQSVKVPLIVHWPAKLRDRKVAEPIESIDLYPTICELAGAVINPGVQGQSLRPLLTKDDLVDHREAVFSANCFSKMVRHENYKLIYYPGRPYGEIYDLKEDPLERSNLWDSFQGNPRLGRMKELLLDWAFLNEDPLPPPVRLGHMQEPGQAFIEMRDGFPALPKNQPWEIRSLGTLYENWHFSEEGCLR